MRAVTWALEELAIIGLKSIALKSDINIGKMGPIFYNILERLLLIVVMFILCQKCNRHRSQAANKFPLKSLCRISIAKLSYKSKIYAQKKCQIQDLLNEFENEYMVNRDRLCIRRRRLGLWAQMQNSDMKSIHPLGFIMAFTLAPTLLWNKNLNWVGMTSFIIKIRLGQNIPLSDIA